MEKEFNVNCRKLMYEVFGKKRNSKDIEKLLNGANINYIKSKVPNHNGEFLFIKESDVDIFINYLKLSKTEKYEKTCQVKYGVNNISQVQSIIDKKKETFNKRKDLHKKPLKRKTLSQRKLRELKILEMYPNQYNKDTDIICSHLSKIFDVKTATIKNYCEYLNVDIAEKYQGFRKVYVINKCDLNIIKNWIEKYPNKNDRMNIIIENTMMKLYGVKRALQSSEFLKKSMNTCKEHYGVEHPAQSEEILENWKKTNLEIYGVENPSQAQSIKDKKAQTTMEHYGVENPFQAEEIIEQINTNKHPIKGHYFYNNISFHSSQEIYFYIYHHDILKDDITRGKVFDYYIDGKKHKYFCDFLLNGENVEIKGRQLINRETMILHTFPHKIPQLEKTKCLRDNNVRIIIDDDEEILRITKIVEKQFPKLVASCRVRKNEIENDNDDYEDEYDGYDISDTIFEM